MTKELLVGITEKGVCHAGGETEFDLETKFRMVRESGVYDYFDKTPETPEVVDEYRRLSEKYDLPIRAGGWFYTLGRDEALLEEKIRVSASLGSKNLHYEGGLP